MMRWVPLLLLAVLLEVAGTTCMKYSHGFTRLLPSVLLFVFYGLSFLCLTFLLRLIDVSVAYAMWAALGTALVAVVGVVLFDEVMTPWKLLSLGLIIAGVVGLRLSGATG